MFLMRGLEILSLSVSGVSVQGWGLSAFCSSLQVVLQFYSIVILF